MRIVADTNTVLSGLLWQGPPRRLIDLARERAVTLCTSATLLAELAAVIARDKFAHRVLAAGLCATELVQDYERLAEIVEPQPLPAPICRDPDDDHVLACATAAQAKLIVSRDKDLLDIREHQGIPMVCPGFVRTPLVDTQIPEQSKKLGISEDEVLKRVMLGGTVDGVFTTVEDVAQTVLFLWAFRQLH